MWTKATFGYISGIKLYHKVINAMLNIFFKDVDEEDVDEVVNTDCRHNITVVVVSTLYQTPRQMLPRVSQVSRIFNK